MEKMKRKMKKSVQKEILYHGSKTCLKRDRNNRNIYNKVKKPQCTTPKSWI